MGQGAESPISKKSYKKVWKIKIKLNSKLLIQCKNFSLGSSPNLSPFSSIFSYFPYSSDMFRGGRVSARPRSLRHCEDVTAAAIHRVKHEFKKDKRVGMNHASGEMGRFF